VEFLPIVDIAIVISATARYPSGSKTSSGEWYPAWNTMKKKEFIVHCLEFHLTGGAFYIFGFNDFFF